MTRTNDGKFVYSVTEEMHDQLAFILKLYLLQLKASEPIKQSALQQYQSEVRLTEDLLAELQEGV